MKLSVLFFLGFVSFPAFSEFLDCIGGYNIKSVYVGSDREGGHFFENKLIVILNKNCAGKKYVTSDLIDNPAFDSFFSTAISAKISGKNIEVGVNTSNGKETKLSNDIAYIGIVD